MSTTPNPATPITQDIPCAQCTYNLRTRLPTDVCPECAHPVADSLQAFSKRSQVFPNPFLASAGLNLIALAFATQFLQWITRVPHIFPPELPWSVNYIFAILLLVFTNVGVATFLYAQRHSRASTNKMYWAGQSINLLFTLTSFVVIIHATLVHFGSHDAAFRSALHTAFPIQVQIAISEVADALPILLSLFFAFYFRRLTLAIHSPRLRFFGIITFSFLTLVQGEYLLSTNILYFESFVHHTVLLDYIATIWDVVSISNTAAYLVATFLTLLLARRIATFPNSPSTPSQDSNHNPQ